MAVAGDTEEAKVVAVVGRRTRRKGVDMPKSLKCKLSSLRYKRLLTDEEYHEIIKKLDGHDREIRNKAIDEFAEKLCTDVESFTAEVNGMKADLLTLDYFNEFVFEIAEQLKGEKKQ